MNSGSLAFIVENNVGKAAKWLRMLGFDAECFTGADDDALIALAEAENRILVTRDRRVMKRRAIVRGSIRAILVESDCVEAQARQIGAALKLEKGCLRPFTICLECNKPLAEAARESVQSRVPPYVYLTQNQFAECPACRRIYWKGTHWQAMNRQLDALTWKRDPIMEKDSGIYGHSDGLSELNGSSRLNEKLAILHNAIRREFHFVDRVAVALFDKKSNWLKTFLASMDSENPLTQYQAMLDDAPGLREVIEMGRPRVVNNLALFDAGTRIHTRRIREKGFASSYTFPFYNRGVFTGFIFFNSPQTHSFALEILDRLDVYAHLIAEIVIAEMNLAATMAAALKTAHQMVHYRDPETGNHLERMSRFARLIAQELSRKSLYELDDETIERIFVFAPMHDIGKIAIPDQVLLKPARLTDEEFNVMRAHTTHGRQIVDGLIHNFGLESLDQVGMLRHIVEYHHETLDGEGYPHGLQDREIPIEARIITVADIFDALTSARPYKPAWSNDDAFDTLQRMARTKLDKDCIDVLIQHRVMVEEIQQRFKDEALET